MGAEESFPRRSEQILHVPSSSGPCLVSRGAHGVAEHQPLWLAGSLERVLGRRQPWALREASARRTKVRAPKADIPE